MTPIRCAAVSVFVYAVGMASVAMAEMPLSNSSVAFACPKGTEWFEPCDSCCDVNAACVTGCGCPACRQPTGCSCGCEGCNCGWGCMPPTPTPRPPPTPPPTPFPIQIQMATFSSDDCAEHTMETSTGFNADQCSRSPFTNATNASVLFHWCDKDTSRLKVTVYEGSAHCDRDHYERKELRELTPKECYRIDQVNPFNASQTLRSAWFRCLGR
jgi:hypothetical protein